MTWVQDKLLAGVNNNDYMLDYSTGLISGHAIASAGYYGAKRYIDDISNPSLVRPKHTTKAEYQDHLANGLHDTLVMEVGKNDPLGGFTGGQQFARRAAKGAEIIGYEGRFIAFCCDRWFITQGATPVTRQMWQDYLGGASSIIGADAVEAYGFSDAMDAAFGLVGGYWQAGSKTVTRDFVGTWQDNNWTGSLEGVGLDRNLMRVKVAGDVPLSDDDLTKIRRIVWGTTHVPDGGAYEGLNFVLTDAAMQAVPGGYADQIRTALRTIMGSDVMQAQLTALVAAHADGDHDLESILQRLEAGQAKAITDAVQNLAVPALTGAFQKFVTEGNVDEQIAQAVIHAFAVRLDVPAPPPVSEV